MASRFAGMRSEGLSGSPDADSGNDIAISSAVNFWVAKTHRSAQIDQLIAAPNRDREIGRERKCDGSRGQSLEIAFSRSRSFGGCGQRPAVCREASVGANPTRLLCDNKDLLAEGGGFEPPIRFITV